MTRSAARALANLPAQEPLEEPANVPVPAQEPLQEPAKESPKIVWRVNFKTREIIVPPKPPSFEECLEKDPPSFEEWVEKEKEKVHLILWEQLSKDYCRPFMIGSES